MSEFTAKHLPRDEAPPLDDFAWAYLEAAEWLLPEPQEDDSEGPSTDEATGWAPEAIAAARRDCDAFQARNVANLAAAYRRFHRNGRSYDEASAGHDFWLTRNGHGAGFWDRGLGALGDILTDSASSFGEVDAYVGDDRQLYFDR